MPSEAIGRFMGRWVHNQIQECVHNTNDRADIAQGVVNHLIESFGLEEKWKEKAENRRVVISVMNDEIARLKLSKGRESEAKRLKIEKRSSRNRFPRAAIAVESLMASYDRGKGRSWEKVGVTAHRGACIRHASYPEGLTDEESVRPHLVHAAARALMALENYIR